MIRMIMRTAALAVSLVAFAYPVLAEMREITLGDLTLSSAFTRAMPPTAKAGGGYVTITNSGTADDRLVSASSPAAPMVQLHEMKMEGDVMKMGKLADGIVIPAGETVALAPGGLHIMFMNVPEPFVAGAEVPVTLTFEKAGRVDIALPVAAIGANMPMSGHDHGEHEHDH